jgi:hypothetical protein
MGGETWGEALWATRVESMVGCSAGLLGGVVPETLCLGIREEWKPGTSEAR